MFLSRCRLVAACATLCAGMTPAYSQIQFQDGFSSAANWSTAATPDTGIIFGHDYSTDAIPQAPNGSDRIGLKVSANIVFPTGVEELAVFPTTFMPSGNYRVSVDVWSNYGLNSGVNTEFPGVFVGHDGTTAGRNGGGLLYTSDGDAARDVRLYKNQSELYIGSLATGVNLANSGQYSPEIVTYADPDCDPEDSGTGDCRDHAELFFSERIHVVDVGLALDPDNGQGVFQTGFQPDGVLGFQWVTLQFEVFPNTLGPAGTTADVGYADVTMILHGDPASPNVPPIELPIGTLDNSSGIGPVINFAGKPAVVYADLFTSVSDTPEFSFGIFDNFLVESLAGGIDGDFNNDGNYNCDDINALTNAVATGGSVAMFDLNGDSMLSLADVDAWRAEAGGVNIGPGRVYKPGDANLNGNVDGSDFGIWNSAKFTSNTAWCSGNFNADANVDGSDFGIWNANKFTSSAGAAVPEPIGGSAWGFVLLLSWICRRQVANEINL